MKKTTSSSSKLSFILYEEKYPPRYFQIRKSSLRFLIIVLPLFCLVAIIFLLYIVLYRKIDNTMTSSIQKTVKEKESSLSSSVDRYQKDLEDKTDNVKVESTPLPQSDILFKEKSFQMKSIRLKDDEFFIRNKKTIVFRFNMINNTEQNRRIDGHIVILMKHGNTLHFYPSDIVNRQFESLYKRGERFSFARYRPVEGTFSYERQEGVFDFKVKIYNKKGDLLHEQIFSKVYHSSR